MHVIMPNTLLASRDNLLDTYGDAKVFDIFMPLRISPFGLTVSLFRLILFVICSLNIIVLFVVVFFFALFFVFIFIGVKLKMPYFRPSCTNEILVLLYRQEYRLSLCRV